MELFAVEPLLPRLAQLLFPDWPWRVVKLPPLDDDARIVLQHSDDAIDEGVRQTAGSLSGAGVLS